MKVTLTIAAAQGGVEGFCEVSGELLMLATKYKVLTGELRALYQEMAKCGVISLILYVTIVESDTKTNPSERIQVLGFWIGRENVRCTFPYELSAVFALRVRQLVGKIAWLHMEHFSGFGRCTLCGVFPSTESRLEIYTQDRDCENPNCLSHMLRSA